MTNATADDRYETLFQAIREALPAESRHLIHDLDFAVGERLAEAEERVAAVAGRAIRAAAEAVSLDRGSRR